MAIIQKIRDKYGKVAAGVIVLAIIGFLLMDASSGRMGDLFGNDTSVAKVNGEKIDGRDYAERIEELQSLYELMGNKVDDNMRAQIHDMVLKEMIFEKITEEDMEDLGIVITKEEEKDMITGPNPDPMVMQFPYFKSPEGGFDPQYVTAFEKNQLPAGAEYDKALQQWKQFKNYIKRQRLIQKYNSLFSQAVYTPKFMNDRGVKDQGLMASINYVKVPFATINDADVKVSDADIKSYMEKHKAQYSIQDPTRSMEYVAFEVTPSADDTAKSLDFLLKSKDEFTATSDNESYVNRNSDEQYEGAFVSKKSFMSPYADSILKMPVGSVFGPYFENGSYKLTKVTEKAMLPDSVKCRHILIKTKDRTADVLADSLAKKRIDSIELAVRSGADFNQLVQQYTDDPGSKGTGGEYTFPLQQRAQLSKEFADVIFDGKTGDKKVVKVENDNYTGYHYIEVLEQKGFEQAAKLATVSKSLFAGEETEAAAYAKANEFAGKNADGKAFDEAVKKQNLNKLQAQNVRVNDFVIPGIGPSREIIRWMYEAKVGEVSPVFPLEGRYVVGKLSNIQEKGLMQLDANNRPGIESMVKSEKKAELIAQKYKSMTSLNAIAQAAGQPVQSVDSFNAASSYVMNLGYEPKVVGYAFFDGLKPGAMSPAIKGQDGVFYVSVKERHQSDAPEDPMMQQQRSMQQMQMKNVISSQIQEVLRRNASIKYNAKNLY